MLIIKKQSLFTGFLLSLRERGPGERSKKKEDRIFT
jgi:hypothetical protein